MIQVTGPEPSGMTSRLNARTLALLAYHWRAVLLEAATLGVLAALLAAIAMSWFRSTKGGSIEPPARLLASESPTTDSSPAGVVGSHARSVSIGSPVPAVSDLPVCSIAEADDPFLFPFAEVGIVGPPDPLPATPSSRAASESGNDARSEPTNVLGPTEVLGANPTRGSHDAGGAILPAVPIGSGPSRVEPSLLVSQSLTLEKRGTGDGKTGEAQRPKARPAPPPTRPATATGEAILEPDRCLVAGRAGEAVVARVMKRAGDRLLITLPDGSIGWAEEEVPTDQPFRPQTVAELSDALLAHEFRDFRAVSRGPYLVFTQGDPAFALESADRLEALRRGLMDALREGGIPTRDPEFPLVAVIFRDRDSFLAHRQVDPEVRAYYEAYSNRIFLYESSDRDVLAPDLAALRRSHSVAHEGVHQILQNIGVQPRLAPWPAWLVEGLAEYYAPPSLDPLRSRARFGAPNAFHMATLHDLRHPSAVGQQLGGPGGTGQRRRSLSADRRKARATDWIERLVQADDLETTEYSLAWVLTHYLATERPGQLKKYIGALGRLAPLDSRSKSQHLEDFKAAFGRQLPALASSVELHLDSLTRAQQFDWIPYLVFYLERETSPGLIKRDALVSQSPATILQAAEDIRIEESVLVRGWVRPFPTRNQAQQAATAWRSGNLAADTPPDFFLPAR